VNKAIGREKKTFISRDGVEVPGDGGGGENSIKREKGRGREPVPF